MDDRAGADLRDELDVVVEELRQLVERAACDSGEPAARESLARREIGGARDGEKYRLVERAPRSFRKPGGG